MDQAPRAIHRTLLPPGGLLLSTDHAVKPPTSCSTAFKGIIDRFSLPLQPAPARVPGAHLPRPPTENVPPTGPVTTKTHHLKSGHVQRPGRTQEAAADRNGPDTRSDRFER